MSSTSINNVFSLKAREFAFITVVLALLIVVGMVISFEKKANGQTQNQFYINVAFPNLTFNQPVELLFDSQTNRYFLVEQRGTITVIESTDNSSVATVFLDIKERVLYGGEQGLLGLALHPNYSQNRYFYVNYVADNPRRTIIARYSAMANNLTKADENSELILLEVEQPFPNHNGGQLVFGPDGYLYIGLGDGGSGGDPFGNGQNRSVLLGKILRIDVDSPSGNRNYRIPVDNPYFGNNLGYREEIYAYGFRNPWRFSFDLQTGRLWVADVGQNQREEIDIVEKGKNYGWNIMEGTLCYSPSTNCNQTGLELPIWEYDHSEGYAIIGGYVYGGSDIPDLVGAYVYGDYGSGKVWALSYNGTGTAENRLLVDTSLSISSFGLDKNREICFTAFDGRIYRVSFIIPEFSWQFTFILFLITTLSLIIKKFSKRLSSSGFLK